LMAVQLAPQMVVNLVGKMEQKSVAYWDRTWAVKTAAWLELTMVVKWVAL
jgi:formate dehydrogenase assembly factor FdhD